MEPWAPLPFQTHTNTSLPGKSLRTRQEDHSEFQGTEGGPIDWQKERGERVEQFWPSLLSLWPKVWVEDTPVIFADATGGNSEQSIVIVYHY